jgi:hypothetical protein
MKIEKQRVEMMTIKDVRGLDAVRVIAEDLGDRQGRITVICFGQAWHAYWGAMWSDSVKEFVGKCEVEYVVSNLLSGTPGLKKVDERNREAYLRRIVIAMQDAFKLDPPASVSKEFPVGVLGHPMREYEPGKWESAYWPSDEEPTLLRDLQQSNAEITRLRQLLDMRHEFDKGNTWYWQPGSDNKVESLACQVVIKPLDLMALISGPELEKRSILKAIRAKKLTLLKLADGSHSLVDELTGTAQ